MQLTANHDTLTAIRTLIDYLRDDERRHYLEQLEQGEGEGHVYLAIAEVDRWLSSQPQVLHMVAGSDDSEFGSGKGDCSSALVEG